jgi:hypothetical protein
MRRWPAPRLMAASAIPPWTVLTTACAAVCTVWAGASVPAGALGLPSGTVVVVVVTETAAPRVDTPLAVLAGWLPTTAKARPRMAATSSTATPDRTKRPRRVRVPVLRRPSMAFTRSTRAKRPPPNRD